MDAAATTLSFQGVLDAAGTIAPHLPRTPAWSYPVLDAAVECQVVVKHENVQPTGAFKVRGGVNLALGLSDDERRKGLVTASTGNHAQSVAYGARLVGSRALIVVPESAPEEKLAAVRALGGEVLVHGPTMTEAVARAHELAESRSMRYVDPGNEPAVVHGHATVHLELFDQAPGLEAVYVPVGSGTSAAGACLVREELAPGCKVIGVQSSAAPAAWESWRRQELVSAPCETRMSGLATGAGFALPQSVLGAHLDDFVLVTDDQISEAAALLATTAHTLAEGAGAAALAGVLADPDRPARGAVICSGGNASAAELRALGAR